MYLKLSADFARDYQTLEEEKVCKL